MEQAMSTSMNMNDSEGDDQDPEDSWLRLSDEIGDIVPGLDLNEEDPSGQGQGMGHRRGPSKAKRAMGKGRNMGKFGRGRRRGGGPMKKRQPMNMQSKGNVLREEENKKQNNLIPVTASERDSVTLTALNQNYVENE